VDPEPPRQRRHRAVGPLMDTSPQFLSLTTKEREIFTAVARGLFNLEKGKLLQASKFTVKTHVGAVLRKLGLRDRVQIVVFADNNGLLN
jgi:DNA-binding NarL/FixJ family response regulator